MRPSAPLVPELVVRDIGASLAFYCDVVGFSIRYDRPEERFAYLEREGAELMIEEPVGRTFTTAPLAVPFGRGVNFQIMVSDLDTIVHHLSDAGVQMLIAPETATYRRGRENVVQRQCVVQDPDGYILRFAELAEQDS